MFQKKAQILKWWGKVFLIALLIVFIVRAFFIQSYTVSSYQMETALLRGDRVLVNKVSYGIRMPMTLLSIPFTFDTFLGFKSYSDLIQLGYHRLFSKMVDRNDVVLFNNPLESDKPLDKRSLYLSRCVAVAGDTIIVKGSDFYLNGIKSVSSPDLLQSFRFERSSKDTILAVVNSLKISPRDISMDSLSVYSTLSRYEVFLINQKLPDSLQLKLNVQEVLSYDLIIPASGMTITLTEFNRPLYNQIINDEVGETVKIEDLKSYTFLYNYYWFLSDNADDAIDSRSLGFISERNIIGKASVIWYSSSDEDGSRWNRLFSCVK